MIRLLLLLVAISVTVFAKPMVDNPYLSISINREDLGSSFSIRVDKKQTNLEVLGERYT